MTWRNINESTPCNNETVNFYVKTSDGRKYVTSGVYTIDPVITNKVLDKDGAPVWYDCRAQIYRKKGVLAWCPLPLPPEELLS